MAFVYILYSQSTDTFYIGSCKDLKQRLLEHQEKVFEKSYTSYIDDWNLYFSIDNIDYSLARKIELHIKRMKSKKYLENIKMYPQIAHKLILKYSQS
ncbi:MAG: GIY-YIG nuclease family protein [Bacteroidota bacterium]|nr:GIY-YIG nuclease family protein [Bacteroidota bacterium]